MRPSNDDHLPGRSNYPNRSAIIQKATKKPNRILSTLHRIVIAILDHSEVVSGQEIIFLAVPTFIKHTRNPCASMCA